jgi:pimeloyl-ACP methyl ester carboxylesterase
MKSDVSFVSDGDTCRAWHFSPDDSSQGRRACIVMGHGFGGTIEAGLSPYAERFAGAGFHVLAFDYRHFGASGGQPRQLLSVERQLTDWASALAFARQLRGVDAARIALWGTSFSGGHVVVAAEQDRQVAAVSAQCPMMDGRDAFWMSVRQGGLRKVPKMTLLALADWQRGRRGRPPLSIPIVARPGKLAAMSTEDAYPGVMAIAPPDFRNEVLARVALEVPRYRPLLHAEELPCPILIQICEKDTVTPIAAALKVAERAGCGAEVKRYPIGHFEIYLGEAFERSVSDQIDFFSHHLPR